MSATAAAGAQRRVTLLCPEALRASACCVEDALLARGWRVRLEFGAQARRVLLRSRRDGDRELRLLCVAERLDPFVEAQLRTGVDPDGKGDFQIVQFDTPRAVIEAVERLGGLTSPRKIRRPPRRGHTYLQHPTLVEQQVQGDRDRRWGIATAVAVAIAAVAAIEAGPRTQQELAPIVRHAHEAPARAADARRFDDPVLAATNIALPDIDLEEDEDDDAIVIIPDEPNPTRGLVDAPRELPPAPLELELEASPVVASRAQGSAVPPAITAGVAVPPSPSELGQRRAAYTVDPFADAAAAADPG